MNAITKEEQTALSLPERAAVALGAAEHEIKLLELVKSSADIIAVIDPAGREQAHRIGMTLKTARVSIEKTGKAAREDATAFSKAVIAEEKRLLGLIVPEEERVLSLRDQFDAAEQRRKDALIAAERARTDAIQAAIQAIRDIPLAMIGKSAQDISRCIAGLVGTVPDEFYQEFIDQAKVARHEALDKLAAAETAQRAIEFEAESQRQEAARQAIAAEEARKAAEKRAAEEAAAVATQRAENERVANELAIAAKHLADQEAAQALVAKQLADKAAANLKADRDAQELAMRLEREKIAAEQAKAIAEIKAARERLDAALAAQSAAVKLEADHADALLMDDEFNAECKLRLESGHPEALEMVAKDAAADLARCTETAKAMHANGPRLPPPESATVLDAMLDAGLDEFELSDAQIEEFGAEWGLDKPALVVRLRKYVADAEVAARADLLVAA